VSDFSFSPSKNLSDQWPPAVATIAIGMACLALFLLGGCKPKTHQDAIESPSPIEMLAVRREQLTPLVESQMRGYDVYQHYCQICHGLDAQGDGFNAAMLDPPPRNFADEAFWKQANDESLAAVISQGGKAVGKSVLMPLWGKTLDEQQIRDVVAYLRTVPELVKKSAEAEQAAESE